MNSYSVLIGQAVAVAVDAHTGHVDRDGLPHFFHCMRVAMKQENPDAMILGLLHDAIEDTDGQEEQEKLCKVIEEIFGKHIIDGCVILARNDGESYSSYISRVIVSGDFNVMNVKKADIEDNTSIGRVDMKAAKNFPMYKEAHVRLCEALGIQSDLSLSSQE